MLPACVVGLSDKAVTGTSFGLLRHGADCHTHDVGSVRLDCDCVAVPVKGDALCPGHTAGRGSPLAAP